MDISLMQERMLSIRDGDIDTLVVVEKGGPRVAIIIGYQYMPGSWINLPFVVAGKLKYIAMV